MRQLLITDNFETLPITSFYSQYFVLSAAIFSTRRDVQRPTNLRAG